MRNGDFSELLAAGVLIYDPLTARNVNGVIVRDPFPGNVIPQDRHQPGRAQRPQLLPAAQPARAPRTSPATSSPSSPGPTATTTRRPRSTTSGRRATRAPCASSATSAGKSATTGRASRTASTSRAAAPTATTGTSRWATRRSSTRTMVFDLRASFLRFNDDQTPSESSADAEPGGSRLQLVRRSTSSAATRTSRCSTWTATRSARPRPTRPTRCSAWAATRTASTRAACSPSTTCRSRPRSPRPPGSHTFRVGYDWRSLRQNEVNEGFRGGQFRFDSTYTRQASNVTGRYGQGVAAFLLGLPTNDSFIEDRSTQSYEVVSHGLFIHDDWRVNSKLTLNVGVRYDLESGLRESQNRNIRGFDLTSPSPIQAQAQAQFAANVRPRACPSPRPSSPRVSSAATSSSTDENPRDLEADKNNVQPRLGITYALTPKTVLRGGVGLYVAPFQISGVPGLANPINQFGYSRNTPAVTSRDNGLTFVGNLTNPVPERSAARAHRREPGALHEPGRQHQCRQQRHGLRGPQEPAGLALHPRHPARAARQLPGRADLPRPARAEHPVRQRPQLRARAVPHHGPAQQHGGQHLPLRARAEPVPRPDARERGQQRRDHRAQPAPAAVPAVRHVLRRVLRRLQPVRRRLHPPGEALHPRLHAVDVVHALAFPREGGAAQPLGPAGGPHLPRRPPSPHHRSRPWRSCLSARAASGGPTGAGW